MLFLVIPNKSDLRLQWLCRGLSKHFRKTWKSLPPPTGYADFCHSMIASTGKGCSLPFSPARFVVSVTWVKDDHLPPSHKPGNGPSTGARDNVSALHTTASSCLRKEEPPCIQPSSTRALFPLDTQASSELGAGEMDLRLIFCLQFAV